MISKFISILMLLPLFCIDVVNAQELTFSKESFESSNLTLPYRKAIVKGDADKASLVMYLHGGSSKGNDNETEMGEPGISSITSWLLQNKRKAIVLVPQCPKDKSWIGDMLGVLKDLLQSYVDMGVVDNVYLFGGSMGGTGTWNMIANYPDFFTSAMPVAGNPTGLAAESISKTPLYTVMGTADRIMKIQPVETLLAELDAYGASYKFDIEQDWTHEDVCKNSYTSDRLSWVFGHDKNTSNGVVNSSNDFTGQYSVQWFDLQGHRQNASYLGKGIYLKRMLLPDGKTCCIKVVR